MKMLRHAMDHADIEKVLELLETESFLDERRYARAFANDKVRFSGWGKFKICEALKAKRLPLPLIEKALEEVGEEDYLEALRKTARSAAKSLDLSLRENRVKLYRHLLSRGFESDIAAEAVREVAREEEG